MTAESRAPIGELPWYRKRWFKRVVIAAIALLTLVAIVAILLFVAWRNSPEKALIDAITYATETPAQYHVTTKDTDFVLTMHDQKYAVSGTVSGVPIEAVLYGSTLYLKSPQPEKLYSFFLSTMSNQSSVVGQIAAAVSDKWIAVNLQSLSSQAEPLQVTQCMIQERDHLSRSADARGQWFASYLAHRFLTIKTTDKKGSTSTYRVTLDHTAREAFYNDLLKNNYYSQLTSCSQDTDFMDEVASASPATDVTLTNDHRIQTITVNPDGQSPIRAVANYNDVPEVAIPQDTVDMDQLILRFLQSLRNI